MIHLKNIIIKLTICTHFEYFLRSVALQILFLLIQRSSLCNIYPIMKGRSIIDVSIKYYYETHAHDKQLKTLIIKVENYNNA